MNLGPLEILFIMVLALVLFGPKRLPEVGKQVGGAMRELRKMQATLKADLASALDEDSGKAAPVTPTAPADVGRLPEPDHDALPPPVTRPDEPGGTGPVGDADGSGPSGSFH